MKEQKRVVAGEDCVKQAQPSETRYLEFEEEKRTSKSDGVLEVSIDLLKEEPIVNLPDADAISVHTSMLSTIMASSYAADFEMTEE